MADNQPLLVPPAEISAFSPTSVEMYARCHFQWFALKILGYREPSNSNLVYGFVHDDAVNWDYAHKKAHGNNRPKGDVQDYFRSAWDAKKDEILDWDEEDPAKLKELGTKGIDVFYTDVMQSVIPVEVQPNLELPFKGTQFRLTGRPDFIDKPATIGDNKTSKTKKPDTFIAQGMQPVLYSLMKDGVQGKPREVRFDILVKAKTGPWVQQMKVVIDENYRRGALNMMSSFVASINSSLATKNFPPSAFARKDWACDYCGCKDLCRKVWGLPVGESKVEVILKDSREAKKASAGDDVVIQKLKKMVEANEALYDKAVEIKRNIVL